ncbi:MAG: hypothetical protein Q9205_005877 [Flavoplaca limonia]
MSVDPTPPAWLRSYKAQSAHIPNFASQVRTELDGKPATKEPPNPKLSEEKETKGNNANDDTTPANQFTFPSTISLTLHNVVSLDKSYSNSTPESSPKKETFHPRLEQHPALREKGPDFDDPPSQKRRGSMCRLLAAIRKTNGGARRRGSPFQDVVTKKTEVVEGYLHVGSRSGKMAGCKELKDNGRGDTLGMNGDNKGCANSQVGRGAMQFSLSYLLNTRILA